MREAHNSPATQTRSTGSPERLQGLSTTGYAGAHVDNFVACVVSEMAASLFQPRSASAVDGRDGGQRLRDDRRYEVAWLARRWPLAQRPRPAPWRSKPSEAAQVPAGQRRDPITNLVPTFVGT